jgi:hypothetical protein
MPLCWPGLLRQSPRSQSSLLERSHSDPVCFFRARCQSLDAAAAVVTFDIGITYLGPRFQGLGLYWVQRFPVPQIVDITWIVLNVSL